MTTEREAAKKRVAATGAATGHGDIHAADVAAAFGGGGGSQEESALPAAGSTALTVVGITASRLAYLEACAGILEDVVRPRAESGHIDAEMERAGGARLVRSWPDKRVQRATAGSSLWDDPPKGWGRKKLLTYFRGELAGRAIVAGNVGQHYRVFLAATSDPVAYWRTWRWGILELYDGTDCLRANPPCDGYYEADEERLVLRCSGCGASYTYEQVRAFERGDFRRRQADAQWQGDATLEGVGYAILRDFGLDFDQAQHPNEGRPRL